MDLERKCEICNKKNVLQHYIHDELCWSCGEMIEEMPQELVVPIELPVAEFNF